MTAKETKANHDLILYRLDEIKTELAEFKKLYVTKVESQALKVEIEGLREDIGQLREETNTEINRIKNAQTFAKWFYPSMSAILGSVMTFLIIEYLKSN